MKKKEKIKQRNKMKVTSDFKLWKYARAMFIIVPIIFMLYTMMTVNFSSSDLEKLFIENPVIVAGFAICLANLFMWYAMGILLGYAQENSHVETIRFHLVLMAIAQFVLLNYISLAFLVLGLYKYLRWNEFSIKTMFQEIKDDKQLGNAITAFCILLFLTLLELLFINLQPIL